MRFYTYKETNNSKALVGVEAFWDSDILMPVGQFGYQVEDMTEFIKIVFEQGLSKLQQNISNVCKKSDRNEISIESTVETIQKNDTVACAPIIYPMQDVICLGINYEEHAIESARYKKEAFGGLMPYPIYFSKRVNEAVADGGSIPAYTGLVDSLDYESELAVIIGKDAKNVSEEDAFDYVFGYTILNDVSARNIQTRHKQWYFGKSMDGFTPMGPCIVSKDEFEIPPRMGIRSYVNGQIRQDSNTELLITGIAHIIAELSSGMTLKAGTIISTGTPKGVGMGFEPPIFLKVGDEVACEIDGIGKITNWVVE